MTEFEKLTQIPSVKFDGTPEPKDLMPAIVELRDAAMKADPPHWDYVLILSQTHAWLYWINENWKEIQRACKK